MSEVSIGDVLSLENLGPEASQLMTVVNLDHVELLEDACVELQLFVFEKGEHFATKVDAHNIVELSLSNQVTLISFEVVLDLMNITRVLEQGSHGFLASLDVLDIFLGRSNLLDYRFDAGLD